VWANDGDYGNHKAAVAVPLLHDVGRFELEVNLPINMRCLSQMIPTSSLLLVS
jgi:hypothetical protein